MDWCAVSDKKRRPYVTNQCHERGFWSAGSGRRSKGCVGLYSQGPARREFERANQMSARSIQSLDADTIIWKVGGRNWGTVAVSVRAGKLRELAILTTGAHWKADLNFGPTPEPRARKVCRTPSSRHCRRELRSRTKTICNVSFIRPRKTLSKQVAHASIWQRNSPMRWVGRRSSSLLH